MIRTSKTAKSISLTDEGISTARNLESNHSKISKQFNKLLIALAARKRSATTGGALLPFQTAGVARGELQGSRWGGMAKAPLPNELSKIGAAGFL